MYDIMILFFNMNSFEYCIIENIDIDEISNLMSELRIELRIDICNDYWDYSLASKYQTGC